MEDMNWGYKTVPQEHLNGRKLDYSRGKGLGGSTAINFGVYITGAQDDYDEWAAEVGDDTFRWENMQRRFKKLESFDATVHVPEREKYVKPNASDHGSQGALRLAFPREWEKDVPLVLDAYEQAGLERNLDHNSGNPLGMALMVNSSYQGQRVTAADLLIGVPNNLLVLTESPVQRVILQDKKAVGVEVCGKQCRLYFGLETP
jgi:choline dehydrogenase-like flavoprotein